MEDLKREQELERRKQEIKRLREEEGVVMDEISTPDFLLRGKGGKGRE